MEKCNRVVVWPLSQLLQVCMSCKQAKGQVNYQQKKEVCICFVWSSKQNMSKTNFWKWFCSLALFHSMPYTIHKRKREEQLHWTSILKQCLTYNKLHKPNIQAAQCCSQGKCLSSANQQRLQSMLEKITEVKWPFLPLWLLNWSWQPVIDVEAPCCLHRPPNL